MYRLVLAVVASLAVLAWASGAVSGGSAGSGSLYFDEITDVILVDGQTIIDSTSTYEARVFLTGGESAYGFIFNEWTNAQEDKTLWARPTEIGGYNFPIAHPVPLSYSNDIPMDQWIHVAFVQDGDGQRLYLNGQSVAARIDTGEVGDAEGLAHVGAIFRDGFLRQSFIGCIDTLRISNVARYTAKSFEPPQGDLTSDENTLLLYNFNQEDLFVEEKMTKITDHSPLERTGTLGQASVDFGTTTPEPAQVGTCGVEPTPTPGPGDRIWGDVDCDGTVAIGDALKIARYLIELSVSQTAPCPAMGAETGVDGTPRVWSDADCDGNVAIGDALKTARHLISLSVSQAEGCPKIGDAIEVAMKAA